jgi:type IV pilus assembly protein PilO
MRLSRLNDIDLKDLARAPFAAQAIVLGLLCLALVTAGHLLFWSPSLETLGQARAQEEALREAHVRKKRQAMPLDAYRQRLADSERALAAMLQQLPNRAEMDALLADVNRLGVDQGLEFELFKPNDEVKADFYATLPVTIKVSGDFHDLASFVSQVARLPRIVTLHDVALAPDKDGRLSLDATVRTYRYLDEAEMAPAPAAPGGKS